MPDLDPFLLALKQGQPIAIPTETVYGLAADASNPDAIQRVYSLKNRPSDHPVIVHIRSSDQLDDWCENISDDARQLATHFWPGPLTLICKRKPGVSDHITAGQDSVAVRCPNHPLTLELLERFGGAIIAPSANPYGKLSPICAQHVQTHFGNSVPVLDGGPCAVGIESTIVDVRQSPYKILRPGILTSEALKEACPHAEFTYNHDHQTKAPGLKTSHYAPDTPIYLLDSAEFKQLEPIANSVCIPLGGNQPNALPNDPHQYAAKLYPLLHKLDQNSLSEIYIERPPSTEDWRGILDRLTRAAQN